MGSLLHGAYRLGSWFPQLDFELTLGKGCIHVLDICDYLRT